MSWQAYVDTSLIGSGYVDQAAIFDATGVSVWATSPNFAVKPEEMKEVVAAFADSSDTKKVYGTGFKLAGIKYTTIRAEDNSLYGKQGKSGVVLVKTKLAILVAHHNEDIPMTNCASTVEALGEYMKSTGY